jgi:uncharacterized protein (UPF0332 family)
MTIKTQWLGVATDNQTAALRLARAGCHRSAVSRAYYAAYAAVHGLLLHFERSPGNKGTWTHTALPGELRTALAPVRDRLAQPPPHYEDILQKAYNARRLADYNPSLTVDARTSDTAIRNCDRLVKLAAKVVQ